MKEILKEPTLLRDPEDEETLDEIDDDPFIEDKAINLPRLPQRLWPTTD